jgi:hypothetical protein
MLRAVYAVRHVERLAQELGLVMKVRAREVLGNLLEQGDIRRLLLQDVDRSLESIAPIHPADALVNVPGNDAQ